MSRNYKTVCSRFRGGVQGHYCAAFAKQLELKREFAHQSRMLELVLNAAGDAIVACNVDTGTTHFNRAAEGLTGYSADEMLGRSVHDLLHSVEPNGSPLAASECVFSAIAAGRELHSGQATLRRRDGSCVPIEYTSSAMADESQLTGCVVVFRDITDRLKAQDQVLQLQARLAHMEKVATVGLLVASVAHEIKNPLTFIRTGLSILERCLRKVSAGAEVDPFGASSKPSSAQEALDCCKDGIGRIVDIVDTLRTFSRIDSQDDSRVNLIESIDATLKLMRASIPSEVCIHLHAEEVGWAHGHPGNINQVLVNVLMNAVQALDGAGDIWIRVFTSEDMVVLEIEDNGPGMAAETLQRIFEPFFTTKPPEQGTGLGLSICRDIVERYGGRMSATTTPGSGTCFRITLPKRE